MNGTSAQVKQRISSTHTIMDEVTLLDILDGLEGVIKQEMAEELLSGVLRDDQLTVSPSTIITRIKRYLIS